MIVLDSENPTQTKRELNQITSCLDMTILNFFNSPNTNRNPNLNLNVSTVTRIWTMDFRISGPSE